MFGTKLFWFDTETTGLDPVANDIIQFSCMVEVDGVLQAEIFTRNVKPYSFQNIDKKALAVNNITIEELQKFNDASTVHAELLSYLRKYIDPYDRNDKLIPAGFNVGFDVGFLRQFFIKRGDKFYGSYFGYKSLDVYALALADCVVNKIPLANHKLTTLSAYYGIKHDNAHDAESDIKATRDLFYRIGNKLCTKT